MAGMTDRTLVSHLMDNMLHTSTASTYTAGTGGSTISWTVPLHLRLYQVTGTETGSGTEQTGTNGYTTGGSSMGTTGGAFNANGGTTAGQSYNNAQVQWTASGTWANATNGVEVWDTSGTPIRILWGALTVAIPANAVTNGDTVTFAASGSVIADASAW